MGEERVSRRRWLEITGSVIGGLVVGGVVGYLSGGAAPAPAIETVTKTAPGATVTKTISKTETVTVPEATPTPVKIGIGAFLSGPFVSEGEHIVNGAQIAIEEIEKSEWWGGRKIEPHFVDLGSVTPDEVKRAFEELINVRKTHINVAYWGSYGPGWDLTLKSGIPLITGDTPLGVTDFIAEHPEIRLVDTYYPIGTKRYQRTFLNFFDWLIKEGIWKPRHNPPTMYIVYSDFVWDADWAKVMQSEAKNGGWNIVGFDLVPMNTVDWSPVLSKIRTVDPDVIIHADLIPADAGTFTGQFTANPTKSLLCNTWGFAPPESIEVENPKALLGVMWGSGTMPIFKSDLYQQFSEKYKKRFGKDPYIAATHTYDSVYIALKAISYAGSTDPEKIYNSIFEIAHQGTEGRWLFNRKTKISYDLPEFAPNQLLQIQEIKGGITQYATVYPPEVAGFEFKLPWWLE